MNLVHNRQLTLSQKLEGQIFREEKRVREQILADQCRASTAGYLAGSNARILRASETPKSIAADIMIHVTLHIPKNPGPGAWAATLVIKDGVTQESDWYPHVTQPLLELEAMIAVLTAIRGKAGTVAIHTTARWIADNLNNGTAEKWQANDWRKSSGDPVQHADSWAEVLRFVRQRAAAVAWLKRDATPEMAKVHQFARRAFQAGRPLIMPQRP